MTAPTLRLGVISSWNVKCGIAEYCAYLLDALEASGIYAEVFSNRAPDTVGDDQSFVHRPWNNSSATITDLIGSILATRINCVLIQYHGAFYPAPVLAALIDSLTSMGVRVFVIYHVTVQEELLAVADSLANAAVNFVHSVEDIERLAPLGLNNIMLLPHGVHVPPSGYTDEASSSSDGFLLGGFGFLMPHKGFLELICATYLLRNHIPGLRLELYASQYPNTSSERLLTRCHAYIRYLNCADYVTLEPGFLDVETLIARLRRCTLLAFPYQHSRESSSAAVRIGMAARRPVLCTPLALFGDVEKTLHKAKGFDTFAIADSVLQLYRDPALLHCFDEAQSAYLREHNWTNIARIVSDVLRTHVLHGLQSGAAIAGSMPTG